MNVNKLFSNYIWLAIAGMIAMGLFTTVGCTHHPATIVEKPGTNSLLRAALKPNVPVAPPLFDGRTLAGWQITAYAAHGDVGVTNGVITIGAGEGLSGLNWTNRVLTENYEISLETRRVSGSDFFCGITFPVGETNCTLVVGGWGGTVVGISSINGEDASENDTTQFIKFELNQWYPLRIRVTQLKIEVWLSGDRIINFKRDAQNLSLRYGEIEMSVPLGLTTYQTTGEIRSLAWKTLGE